MQKIVDYAQQEMKWEQPNAFKEQYELHVGDETIAALRFRSMWGSLAAAESADGCWSFKRVGFFKTRVTVRPCDSEQDIAVYYPNTWSQGGTIEFPDGRKYKASTNFWMSKVDITDENEAVVIRYNVGGFIRQSAQVEVEPTALRLPDLPMLVMLGWYLIILMYQDSAVVASVAAVS
jgi:hypothetical protein